MPLGGIGAGHVAIAADGSLRQWQLANTVNHQGFVPQSFFALRVSAVEPPLDVRRTLRSMPVALATEPAPLVSDHLEPVDLDPPTAVWPAVPSTAMSVAYPFARIEIDDAALPVSVAFDAWTPFVPLDADASGMPIAAFTFRIDNRVDQAVHGWLVASLQNAVGWDGVTGIEGNRCPLYGGNLNESVSLGSRHGGDAILMTNPSLRTDDPRSGEMLIASDRPSVPIPRATSTRSILRFVEALKLLVPGYSGDWSHDAMDSAVRSTRPPFTMPAGPSPPGTTWTSALAIPFALSPGERTSIEVIHAWWFPERVADFDQFGVELPVPQHPPRIGNHYATRFGGAVDVAASFVAERERWQSASRAWADALSSVDAPGPIAATLATQPALVRSPTTFRDEQGRLLGFEGCLGASTLNWNGSIGGSCPLNCTHVWNYEQTVAALFPALEVTMRDIEWDVLQAPDGSIPHRLRIPVDGPQLQGQSVGGPEDPALDGMLGAVLKTLREARSGGGRELVERRWPAMSRLIEHVAARWDPSGQGVLVGPQPMTYDIDLTQPNAYIGSLWIAALRAMQRMASALGRESEASGYGTRAARSSAAYDALLWNGSYFGRDVDGTGGELGSGCLADQLNGQWWAHQLELGHVLPADRVRTALRAIVANNLRHGFRDVRHGYRSFADADDAGLLICSWPDGGRPRTPVRYADEVWTGIEYSVAALCIYEGLVEEAMTILAAVRARYDGTRRNPYNEIECGDHYSRAMAGWSLLHAWTGHGADALDGSLRLGPRHGHAPLLAGTAWGRASVEERRASVEILGGSITLESLTFDALGHDGAAEPVLGLDGRVIPFVPDPARPTRLGPRDGLTLAAGSHLELSW